MKLSFAHTAITVLDLQKSIAFYEEALGLREISRKTLPNGRTIVLLGSGEAGPQLEVHCFKDRTSPYDLGENEFHFAFSVDDFAMAHFLHAQMNCIQREIPGQNVYFIHDPDGYLIEIMGAPQK